MKQLVFFIFLFVGIQAKAESLKPAWELTGFNMPESVVYDSKRDMYYISNVNGDPFAKDANGSISAILGNGKSVDLDWVTGLDSPKGLALRGKYLYVADIGELVVIDLEAEKITARYLAPQSRVLNGIAVSETGDVFISDWMDNKIYKVEEHRLNVWLDSPNLEAPNGLFLDGKYLYVSAWGNGTKADFTTESSGKLKRISLKSKHIENLDSGDRWLNLDGLHQYGESNWLATDFIAGELLDFDKNGSVAQTFKLEPSAADFYYNAAQNLVVIPYLLSNKVVAYHLPNR